MTAAPLCKTMTGNLLKRLFGWSLKKETGSGGGENANEPWCVCMHEHVCGSWLELNIMSPNWECGQWRHIPEERLLELSPCTISSAACRTAFITAHPTRRSCLAFCYLHPPFLPSLVGKALDGIY